MNVDEVLAKMDALDASEEEIQYIIDENLRVISIPPLGVVLGVEGDKDVNSAKFKMVRYYKGIDLSKFEIRINFANANGDLSYYTVKNPTVTDDTLTFEWLVGYLVTKYKGTVRFVVRMITTDASTGEVQQAFDTTVGEARSLEGLLVDTPTDEKVYDIVAQLKADLTDHVNNLLETIPEDYSELTKKVEDNTLGISELKEDISYDEKQLLSKTSNLLNWKNAEIFFGYNDGSKLVASPNNDFHTVIVPVSVPYITSFFITRFGVLSSRFSVATIREKAVNGTITYNTQQNNTAKSIQISARPEDTYLAIWFAGANDTDWESYLKNITVIKGIFAPEYYIEPVENNAVDKVIKIYEENELNRTTNLFNCNNPMLFYGMNTGSILRYGNQCCILIPVNESSLKAYTVSRFGEKGKYFSVATLHDEPEDGVSTYNTKQDNNAESIQIYVKPDDKYIVIWFYTNSDTVKMKDIMDGIVVLRRYIPATGFIPYFKKNNPLFGKKINFLGDSFTDDAISYEYQLTDRLCLDNIHVGKGNSAIVTDTNSADSFLTRMSALDENADITIIFGGINDARDIGNGSIVLGEIDSTHDKTSFYGGMQLLLDNIIAKTPAQFILGVIPPSFQPNKPYTTWIPQIQKAEREIYNKYHIPFVDLDKDCFAMSDNPTIMALYRKSTTGTTNYHPNALGAKKIADCVQGELEKYIH